MFYKLIRCIAKWLVHSKFLIEIIGIEHFPKKGPVILAANHVSNFDPLILGSVIGREIHFLAKKELYSFRPARWFLKKLQAIPVDRCSGNVIRPVRCCLRVLNNGEVIGIFPEGKRCKKGEWVEPKKGAAFLTVKTGAPIIPVALIGVQKGFRKPIKVHIGMPVYPFDLGVTDYTHISQTIMNQIRKMM